jgi:hypothetical protein
MQGVRGVTLETPCIARSVLFDDPACEASKQPSSQRHQNHDVPSNPPNSSAVTHPTADANTQKPRQHRRPSPRRVCCPLNNESGRQSPLTSQERSRGVTNEFTSFVDCDGSTAAISGAAASPPHAHHREVSIQSICNQLCSKTTHTHLISSLVVSCTPRKRRNLWPRKPDISRQWCSSLPKAHKHRQVSYNGLHSITESIYSPGIHPRPSLSPPNCSDTEKTQKLQHITAAHPHNSMSS